VLAGDHGELPAQQAALARLAATVTAEPWALTRDVVEDVAAEGVDPDALEAAAGVVALFNYFTRVADATGIEFDYTSPLPAFEADSCRVPAPRPAREAWPLAERRDFVRRPRLLAAWQRWREYVLGSPAPLDRRMRRLLAAVAAEECCDAAGFAALTGESPQSPAEEQVVAFARRLSRQPWAMGPDDLNELRAAGYLERALLHAISVVAFQNADSRLAFMLRFLD
jgi:alkylhydroperoxidase family enzyme